MALLIRCAVAQNLASLPLQSLPGCSCRCVCFGDLLSEKSLEIFSYHCGWATFYDLSYFGVETHAAKIRKAPYSRQKNIDDEPFDILVCALGHDEVRDESWIACGTLQRIQRTCISGHQWQLGAFDAQGRPAVFVSECPSSAYRFDENPTLERLA